MLDKSFQNIINRYKRVRSFRQLNETYKNHYALMGLGNHSLNNILPVIQYLQIPLKYIYCTSRKKAELIEQKYRGVKGTHSLQEILEDDSIKGVFVATSPESHFEIAQEVLNSRKALFIEKPPCKDSKQLDYLIDLANRQTENNVVVGLQKRFAPCTQILKKELKKNARVHSYHYRYLTGLYPEGDPVLDLFIHPIDHVNALFGKSQIKSITFIQGQSNGRISIFLVLEHENITGQLELSTCYSWQGCKDELEINTSKGIYSLDKMSSLVFSPKQQSVMGIPLEKVYRKSQHRVILYETNQAIPIIANNAILSQGYFPEVKAFVDLVEKNKKTGNAGKLSSLKDTYHILDEIRKMSRHS